jgi:hypothetical protein
MGRSELKKSGVLKKSGADPGASPIVRKAHQLPKKSGVTESAKRTSEHSPARSIGGPLSIVGFADFLAKPRQLRNPSLPRGDLR